VGRQAVEDLRDLEGKVPPEADADQGTGEQPERWIFDYTKPTIGAAAMRKQRTSARGFVNQREYRGWLREAPDRPGAQGLDW
jgi:hypothetical protein